MDRRSFIASVTIGGLAGFGLAACERPSTEGTSTDGAAARRVNSIGLQLYTIRDRMSEGVPEALAAVAAIGYREVETAGLFNLTPEQFRAELDRVGLVSPAGHYNLNDLRANLDGIFATAEALGQRWVVVPSLGGDERTADGFRQVAADLNRFGAAAVQRGLRIGYHNHDFEFQPVDGDRNGYDILLEETDPELVDLELDIFWAVRGGEDPIALFNRQPGRFTLCHVKDMADMAGQRRMTEVGQGEIDFARILGQSQLAGLQHYFIEHDTPQDSLASIRTSYEHLSTLDLVEG